MEGSKYRLWCLWRGTSKRWKPKQPRVVQLRFVKVAPVKTGKKNDVRSKVSESGKVYEAYQ